MHTDHIEIDDAVAFLNAAPLCDGLKPAELAGMAAQLTLRTFFAGETLAGPDDAVDEFWVLVEGEIESYLIDARGRESLLGVIGQGETIGEVALLENSSRPIRFTARTHGALLAASAETFRTWLDDYPPLLRNLFRSLRQRFKRVIGVAERMLPSPRLGIIASSVPGHVLVGRLAAGLLVAGERLQCWAENPAALRSAGNWPESMAIEVVQAGQRPLLDPLPLEFDRQVIVWSPAAGGQLDPRLFRDCDEVLWLIAPRDAAGSIQEVRQAITNQAELAQKLRIVWLLDKRAPVAPSCALDLKKAAVKVPVESAGNKLNRLERHGLDRLVRTLRGYSIGMALAGGGAKGMAHLGVLRVLEEAGLSFDAMSGSSAGAMAGIIYAAGMSPDYAIECFQHDLTPSRWFQMLPSWPNWYLLTKFRRLAWDAMLRRYLHDWRLEQLAIPFHAVAVDLVQARPIVRSEGDAVHAILESINLPVLSRPILRDGMVLVDGGMLNNLPADVLADRGVDYVVGVDVSRRVRFEFAGNRSDMKTSEMKSAGALETLLRIFEAQAHSIGNIRNRAVDFWITPDTSGFGLAEFHRTREIAAAGEAAALAQLNQLKQRLAELQQRLFGLPRHG